LGSYLQELKGNIRVFCRVRPLLSDGDSKSQEEALISYPSSVENAGRGIELVNQGEYAYSCFLLVILNNFSHKSNNKTLCLLVLHFIGQKCSFSYDKVFSHSASQDDVFVEMSQLVQSALDGYKVTTSRHKLHCSRFVWLEVPFLLL
jgi:kinesin family protein C1